MTMDEIDQKPPTPLSHVGGPNPHLPPLPVGSYWCHFFHRWEQWSAPYNRHLEVDKVPAHLTIQDRYCIRCGVYRWRKCNE